MGFTINDPGNPIMAGRSPTRSMKPENFDLYIEATDSIEHPNGLVGPRYVKVHVNKNFMEMVRSCQDVGKAVRFEVVPQTLAPTEWDIGDEIMPVNSWEFFVDKNRFWYAGKDSRNDSVTLTSPFFGLDKVSFTGVDSVPESFKYRWFGGCLLYTESDMDDFVGVIHECCPKVAAKETELRMAARIREYGGSVVSTVLSSAVPARRRTIGL